MKPMTKNLITTVSIIITVITISTMTIRTIIGFSAENDVSKPITNDLLHREERSDEGTIIIGVM